MGIRNPKVHGKQRSRQAWQGAHTHSREGQEGSRAGLRCTVTQGLKHPMATSEARVIAEELGFKEILISSERLFEPKVIYS